MMSAGIYTFKLNQLQTGSSGSFLLLLTREWYKPQSSLILFQVLERLKLGYLSAKILSWLIITIVIAAFSQNVHDARTPAIIMLSVATAHSFIVFQNYRFEEERLTFVRNFPIRRAQLFLNLGGVYLFLILPETTFLFTRYDFAYACRSVLLAISTVLAYRVVLYCIKLQIFRYLLWVMSFFVVFFVLVLFNWITILIVFNLLLSYGIFYQRYHHAH